MGTSAQRFGAVTESDGVRPAAPRIHIKPVTGWTVIPVGEIVRFRDLLFRLGLRDLTLRYRQTFLGVAWVLIQPIAGAGALTFVFGRVAKLDGGGLPYFLITLTGLIGWNVFSGTLAKSSQSLLANAQLVGKIYFPRLLIPMSTCLSTLIDFGISCALLVVLLPLHDVPLTWRLLTLPLWAALILSLSLGLGFAASAMAVRFRDIQHVLPVLLQLLLFVSPVAYTVAAVPARFRTYLLLNPLTSLLDGVRWAALGRLEVGWDVAGISGMAAIAVGVLGAMVFNRLERGFADVL